MEALQTIDIVRHLPLSRHSNFVLHLHGISSVWVVGLVGFSLLLLMIRGMFSMQLYLSLTLNLLQILWSRLLRAKRLLIR